MHAVYPEQGLRRRLLGGRAGQTEAAVIVVLAALDVTDLPLDAVALADIGEVQIVIERGGGTDAPLFQATMAEVDLFSAEGGNAPKGALGGRRAAWVDCL